MNENTIQNNCIKQFILRIDFADDFPIVDLLNGLRNLFIRVEERKLLEVEFTINSGANFHNVSKKDHTDQVLVGENGATLTLSNQHKAIIFSSNYYLDNSVYKELLAKIISVCSSVADSKIYAKRIGLRYVNEFPCSKLFKIGKIFQRGYATAIKNLLQDENVNRAILVQFRKKDDYNSKIQFGIINKFFPAEIINYDLLLDIDSYFTLSASVDQWDEIIKNLNHNSFSIFNNFICEKYIKELKNA